jgi:hypothetical protein
MGTTSGVLWIHILKDEFENQMTGMFFPMSLILLSVSFFLKREFNVTGIFLGLNSPVIWPQTAFFKERENNFVMCCQSLGQTSLIFIFYSPMTFLPNQLNNRFNNKQIISRIANLPFVIILILS